MRLLIVEDEVRLASALQRGLIGEGFTVDVAHTGPDGLHAAQESSYDAVILDIMLPGLSGYRIIERLRAGQNWVPILMLTAKDGEYDEADALDLGADDYLTKPFSFVVLLARLRALLRRGVTPRPASLTVGDLVLDPAAHTVSRAGRNVDLTPREFALLEFLMRRAGEAVSKADILHHVWDAHYEGDANVVEVYVGYLRRKIDAPFGRQSVQTVRGAGYRLAGEVGAPTGGPGATNHTAGEGTADSPGAPDSTAGEGGAPGDTAAAGPAIGGGSGPVTPVPPGAARQHSA